MRLGHSSAETKDQIECKNPDTKLQAVVEDLTNNSFRLTIMESDNDNSKIVWSKIGKVQQN